MSYLQGDPVVEIGREKYGVHIFNSGELERYLKMVNENKSLRRKFKGFQDTILTAEVNKLVYKSGEEEPLLNLFQTPLNALPPNNGLQDGDKNQVGYVQENGEVHISAHIGYVSWLPCLIPLSQDYRIMKQSFERDNPDGTVITGLYFMAHGEPNGLKEVKYDALYLDFEREDDLMLIDEEEAIDKGCDPAKTKPIEWIVFEGMLVAKRALARLPIDSLLAKGHMPYLWHQE